MKILRSPWVTGVLVLVAVGVVFYQVVRPQLNRLLGSGSAPPAQPAPTAPAQQSAAPPQTGDARPATAVTQSRTLVEEDPARVAPINLAAIEQRFERWVEAPQRDPFLLVRPASVADLAPSADAPPPTNNFRLKGIWQQTGSKIAAINNGVYREGDVIEGFRVERIEGSQVWLSISNRLQRLEMFQGQRGTNAPALPTQAGK
jgi:hypothetical protein